MSRSQRLKDANYTTSGRGGTKSSAGKGAPKKAAPAKRAAVSKAVAPKKAVAAKKVSPKKPVVTQKVASTKRPPTPVKKTDSVTTSSAATRASGAFPGVRKLTIGDRVSTAASVVKKGGVARRNRRNAAEAKNKDAGDAVNKMLSGMDRLKKK